jgi:Kdo2-lipid IVA lauroyltransferase/acyltransferase
MTYAVVRRLPRSWARLLGRLGGRFARLLLRSDARRTARNLRRLPADSRPTVSQVFEHLGLCVADACTLPTDRESLDELVVLGGEGTLQRRLRAVEGTVWISGHVGHWELPAAWAAARGNRVYAIAAPIHYPALDSWVRRLRLRHGIIALRPDVRGLREALRALQRGDHVVFLLDQHLPGQGVWVPFLGSPAWTSTAPARLARMAGVPLGGGRCTRLDDGRYGVTFGPLLPSDGDSDTVTAEISGWVEDAIREQPEQWVWMHDRWRTPG